MSLIRDAFKMLVISKQGELAGQRAQMNVVRQKLLAMPADLDVKTAVSLAFRCFDDGLSKMEEGLGVLERAAEELDQKVEEKGTES